MLTEVKNDEIYEMPITDEYHPILTEYMSIRQGEPDDYLFCNQYGNKFTADGLRAIMRKYNLKCGVDTTSLHRFRNTFAKNWIIAGGSAKKLQYALGHLHACLRWVSRSYMTNSTLRERFTIDVKNSSMISRLLKETCEAGLIKISEDSTSAKNRKYLPYWA